MDKRSLLILMVGMALLLLWPVMTTMIAKRAGWDISQPKPTADATTQPAEAVATTGPGTSPTTVASLAAQQPATGLHVVAATQASSEVQIGSAAFQDPTYRMAVRVDPQGAGINEVLLNEFRREARSSEPYTFQEPYPGLESLSRPLGTRSIKVNGKVIDLGDVNWTVTEASQDHVTLEVVIAAADSNIARVRKTLQVLPASDVGKGYEFVVTQTIQNLTAADMKAGAVFNGTTVPPRESDRGGDRQMLAGFADVEKRYIDIQHDMIESFTKDKPTRDYTKDSDGRPVVWAGTASIYFNALIRPLPLGNPDDPPRYIEKVEASLLNFDTKPGEQQIATAWTTAEQTIAAGQSLTLSTRAFFGPRQRGLLNSDYYSSFPLAYSSTLVLTSGPCGVCTFQWLIEALVWLLAALHWLFGGFAGRGDWGLAIIALVVLVRLILHPITKKSQISMAKMSKLGPEMERLKKKYADNKEELNKAMMEFYKQQGVGPYLGCLPMFLQMPIWIALWQALQTTFELRQAPFLWGFTWIHDLSKADHLITFRPIEIPLMFTSLHVSALNLLPILMGLVFWVQMKFQPKPASLSPEQEQQQKIMQYMMPFLFPLMLYNGPSGLNLYIFTSTLIGIVESKIVRDHIKQREEEEKAGRVIVDAGKKFKGGDRGGGGMPAKRKGPEPDKPRGLMGWFAELQERAEQIRREADKRK